MNRTRFALKRLLLIATLWLWVPGCGGGAGDPKEKSGEGVEALVAETSVDYGCAARPGDPCGGAVCALLGDYSTYASAYVSYGWWKDYQACIGGFLRSFDAFCSPGETSVDEQEVLVVYGDFLRCLCQIGELRKLYASYGLSHCE